MNWTLPRWVVVWLKRFLDMPSPLYAIWSVNVQVHVWNGPMTEQVVLRMHL